MTGHKRKIFAVVILLLLLCTVCTLFAKPKVDEIRMIMTTAEAVQPTLAAAATATTETQVLLTAKYGNEVSEVIKNYESRRLTLSPEEKEYIEFKELTVFEYEPKRFKAFASFSVPFEYNSIEECTECQGTCGMYVFLREDDDWEFAAFFLMATMIPDRLWQDWYYLSPSTKETIGERPEWVNCGWIPCAYCERLSP